MRNRARRKMAMLAAGCLLLAGAVLQGGSHDPIANATGNGADDAASDRPDDSYVWNAEGDPRYSAVLKRWQADGYRDADGARIGLSALRYVDSSAGSSMPRQVIEGLAGILLEQSEEWVEYEFEAAVAGLYQLRLDYFPLPGTNAPVQIGVMLDGSYPFAEAKNIPLPKNWQDAYFPAKKDERGNDIRPPQIESRQWSSRLLTDNAGAYDEPLRWYLGPGKHKLRIQSVYEPMVLAQLAFESPEAIEAYDAVRARYPEASGAADWYGLTEAENMSAKSDPALQMQPSYDDLAVPKSDSKIVFNMMGGTRWKRGGQTAEWTFSVPEDGLYEIELKYLQNAFKDRSSFRQIHLDGRVPFAELRAYPFPYTRIWKGETLSDGGEPYRFYLTRGEHVLSLTSTAAPATPAIEALSQAVDQIQRIVHDVKMVAGTRGQASMDANRDWELEKFIPDIREQLVSLHDRLTRQLENLNALYGHDQGGSSGLRSAIVQLGKLVKNPNLIPKKSSILPNVQEQLSTYIGKLAEQPLALDQIYVKGSDARIPNPYPSGWTRFVNVFRNFAHTFSPDYYDYGRQEEGALTVWVNRGRDYVTLMQQIADEQFTPQTGIKVNINMMPNAQLLILSNAAGRAPDVALGLDAVTPVDLAMRNALLDLSEFDDYEEAAKPFSPGALLPFHYQGGDYALPETLALSMMFYRKDIFRQLEIEPPDTWDEFKKILPTLQQNGYDFAVQPTNYLPFVYQNGAGLYTADGLQSGLGSPEAIRAFKQWTDLFAIYGLPKDLPNFYMHFRNGDMPIGMSDFNTYILLLVAAPEIAGSWGILPIPGITNGDGVVERWTGGMLQSGVIFKSTPRAEEAWRFLKWWASTEVQTRYGTDLELFNGTEFRWNTANYEALQRLPWQEDQKSQFLSQMNWFKEAPNVPGGYFTQRQLTFAWNRTVLDGVNYRESLDQAVEEINRELLRKQVEFGLVGKEGTVQRHLDIPIVDKPWKGDP